MVYAKNNDLISVVVPVYNVEKYLNQCIDSLLGQTYKNLEIIMVDDGSKDSSGKICDDYAAKHQNCKVIHKENAGLGLARNTGLANISGKYVTFLDSDDWGTPELIEHLYNGLVAANVDMCKSGFQHVSNEGEIFYSTNYTDEVFEGEKARFQMLPRMIGSCPTKHDSIEMAVCGVLYKTSPIIEHNLRFPSERELISEDLVFNIDYMQYANGACTISNLDYCYRMNNNSLTTSYRPDRYDASSHFYLEMRKKLKTLNYDEMTFLRLKRMFFIYTRMSISQETARVSGFAGKENIRNIRRICSDVVIRDAIKTYPVNKLGPKQGLFLRLIQKKDAVLLYLLASIGKV